MLFSLYVEQVDVGEEAPRTIISGLVKYIPIEDMQVNTPEGCHCQLELPARLFLSVPLCQENYCFPLGCPLISAMCRADQSWCFVT